MVLIVEDHARSREVLRDMVRALGARAVVAAEGGEALELLAATHPDVVLCDLKIPGMDGFEFAKQVRADPRHRRVVLIALSGLGTDRDFLRTLEAGFDSHLVKPVDADTLGVVLARFTRAPREIRSRPRRRGIRPLWPRSA